MRNIWFVLSLNSLAFCVNFILWTLLAIVGIQLKEELSLSQTQHSLLLAMPFLTATLFRIPMDMLAERFSGRAILSLQLSLMAIPCYLFSVAEEYWQTLILASLLGFGGATFCLGISFASKYFPERQQGLALAIFSAGIFGLLLTYLLVAPLSLAYGWRFTLKSLSVGILFFALLYALLTLPVKLPKVKLNGTTLRTRFKHIGNIRVWRFGLYYFFVFGCFMATALWLPYLYMITFELNLLDAGFASLCFAIPTIIGRKISLILSEKYSATFINWSVFWTCMACLFFLSFPSTSIIIHGVEREISLTITLNIYLFSTLIGLMGFAMGVGTSSVYRLISKYYPSNLHGISCLVSSIGVSGGFVMLVLYGFLLDLTAIPSSCFILLYIVLGSCMIWMYYAIKRDEFEYRIKKAIDSNFLDTGENPFQNPKI